MNIIKNHQHQFIANMFVIRKVFQCPTLRLTWLKILVEISNILVGSRRLPFSMAKTKESALRASKSPMASKASPKSATRPARSPATGKPKKPAAAKTKRAPPKPDCENDERPLKQQKFGIPTPEGMKKLFATPPPSAESASSQGTACATSEQSTKSRPADDQCVVGALTSGHGHDASNPSQCATALTTETETKTSDLVDTCPVAEQPPTSSDGAVLPEQSIDEHVPEDSVHQAIKPDGGVGVTEAALPEQSSAEFGADHVAQDAITRDDDHVASPEVCNVKAKFAADQARRKESIGEFLNWPTKLIQTMWKQQPEVEGDAGLEYGDMLSHLRGCICGLRVSTAFSGIDTPCVALDALAAAVATQSGDPIEKRPKFQNVYGVEWYSKSQYELQRSPHGPHCLFSDISEFWSQCMKQKLDTLIDQGQLVDVLTQLLSSPTTDMSTITCSHAHCLNCNKMCEVTWITLACGVRLDVRHCMCETL